MARQDSDVQKGERLLVVKQLKELNMKLQAQRSNDSADKEAEIVSEHEATNEEKKATEATSTINAAVEAAAVQAVLLEPLDEIENAIISEETKGKEFVAKDKTNVLSVIPLKNFNLSDDILQKAVKDKLEARNFKVKEIEIHRSIRGTFTRGDVLIEPVPGELIKKIDFGFENCLVVPFYGFVQSCGMFTISLIFKVDVQSPNIVKDPSHTLSTPLICV